MTSPGVTNGSHFNMRVRTMTGPAWKNNFDVENEVGKSIGSIWNHRTSSARYQGYEAPVINFTGIIDITASALGSDGGGSLWITMERLGSMALAGSAYVIYPMIGNFLANAGFVNGSVPCVINSVTPSMDMNYATTQEYLAQYNMQITLVSGF